MQGKPATTFPEYSIIESIFAILSNAFRFVRNKAPYWFGEDWPPNVLRNLIYKTDEILNHIPFMLGNRVLELGSGSGTISVKASQHLDNIGSLYCLDLQF